MERAFELYQTPVSEPEYVFPEETQKKLLELKENLIFFQESFPFSPLKPEQLKISGNGIELKREVAGLYHEGSKFENKCFNKLLTKPGESVILGPALIDYIMPNTPLIQDRPKPDAIKFDIYDRNLWKLTELYEFKSGRNHNVDGKLKGFSILLKELRDYPHLMPNLLDYSLSGIIKVPSKIIVPKDISISVTFIYSSKGNVPVRPRTDFFLKFDHNSKS